jgi:hypothetical protein
VNEEDIRDPRVVPRWLPVGISGVPRSREWDVVIAIALPELEGSAVSELGLTARPDGVDVEDAWLLDVATRIAEVLDGELARPFEALAVRRSVRDWSVAARNVDADWIELPPLGELEELTVARTPDGDLTVFVDGEEVERDESLEAAARALETRALERHDAFVARAVRSGKGWAVTIDPL